MPSEKSRWSDERGFGFVETLISIDVLTAVSVGVARPGRPASPIDDVEAVPTEAVGPTVLDR
jgi:hypothetical protein